MCCDIFVLEQSVFDFLIPVHCSTVTMGRQIRSEYVGDIFDDPSLCQRICALTAYNSSTETMPLSSGRGIITATLLTIQQ